MGKPTRVRYLVLFVVCLVYFITYIDRVNLSVAAPYILKEFHITKVELGIVLAAFNWAYFLFQIPVGMLGDKFGPRKVLSGLVTVWSVMTAATGLAWSFASMVAIRLVFGASEAGAFPNATRAFSHWIPSTMRGLAQGLTHGFSRFGGAVTPIIVVMIMARFGWRPVFFLFGLVGLAWAAFWYYWYRDNPAAYQRRWGHINQDEIDLINQGKVAKKSAAKLPFGQLIKSHNMQALCLAYFCYNYSLWIYMSWLPTYLVQARGFTMIKMGIFASLPLLAGTIGDTLGGWLSDRLWVRTKNGRLARRAVAMTGLLISAAFMIPGAMTTSQYWAVFFLACSLFGLEMSVGVYWAVCLDIGSEYAGTVSGTMNCVGNVGGAITPIVFGMILQSTGSWVYPFILASAVLVVGALLWLRINPERSVGDELGLGVPLPPAGAAPHTTA